MRGIIAGRAAGRARLAKCVEHARSFRPAAGRRWKRGLGELQDFGRGQAHLGERGVFAAQVGFEHGGVVGGKADGHAGAKKLRQGMVGAESASRSRRNLAGQRAGAQIAGGADFQGNVARGEQVHRCGSRIAAMPWPMRSAPSISTASRTDSGPPISPAWIRRCRPCAATNS